MSMKYIRDYYKVPAKRGAKIIYTGQRFPLSGTIVGSRGAHLRIRLDGEKRISDFHPTWEIEYMGEQ